ncbi:TIGR04141 family sporadically distributed protein [Janthinobacterium sp. BJB304]|uniref:TIGR04141 family sporadically distributed protein n=1 Tax=Janthinobacterium sp. BJB304 TaxID=1572871 RepID=UPI000C0DA7D0|nr:TIGR04141 family sporadically distributed protein [Janthinobacterium sp. BJB304]PHV40505.1 sporadically distributed protein, TIGR04141 family [Janthinobacterium sp. BJB304]
MTTYLVESSKGSAPTEQLLALNKKRDRKEKLSIYLLKNDFSEDTEILKLEDSKDPIKINIQNGSAILYVKKESSHPPPSWTNLFTSHQKIEEGVFGSTRSVGAAFTIRKFGKIFVLTFGTGHHLLKQDSIERDFGLRVTLNSVDPDKLRSLDKASYENNPLNSRIQSSREVDIFQLRTDSELELVYAVTGVSEVPIFGSHVTGRDALSLAVTANIDGLSEILEETLHRYQKKLPQQFDWIDNINRIKDPEEIEILDIELDQVIEKGDLSSIYLGEPEIVDWENQIGYSFDLRAHTYRHPVLQLENLVEYITKKGLSFCVREIKSTLIHINNSDYQSSKSWSAYRCICAEILYADRYNILRNGIWYKVANDYVATLDKFLSENLKKYDVTMPDYNFNNEDDYNKEVAKNLDFHLMDRNLIKIGGPSDKVEFCDLIYKNKKWIHVKYYRSSATLSHLFSQGAVAAQAFIGEPEFRKKLSEKMPIPAKLQFPERRPDTKEYEIVYAIATKKKVPVELPFFSKVTLKQAIKAISMMGFSVSATSIPVDPIIHALKLVKPKKNETP